MSIEKISFFFSEDLLKFIPIGAQVVITAIVLNKFTYTSKNTLYRKSEKSTVVVEASTSSSKTNK